MRRGLTALLAVAVVSTAVGPGTPSDTQQVGSPAHGPDQRWGDAAGLAHEESADRGNVADPESLQSKYPPIEGQADPSGGNEARVVGSAERSVSGFDAATSQELPELRGSTQRTFANADGTRTTEFSREPMNFRRADGSWEPIDTRLVPQSADGSGREGWRNAADSVRTWTAPTADAESLVRMDIDAGHRLEFGVDGAAPSAGVVQGNTVTYPAVRSAADLRLEVTSTGIKESLLLASPDAPHSWLFPLKLTGMKASVVDGAVVFRDEQGKERARIPQGFMFDSAYDDRKGEYATSYGVAYELVEHQGGQAVRMTLDTAWLRDPARVYPVTVDPPVDVRAAAASMYVQRNSDGSNFSRADGDLKVGHSRDSGGSYTAASYLWFPGVESTLRNHKIFGAQLALTNYHSWSCNPRPITVHPVTQNWAADNNSQYPGPSFGPALASKSFARGFIPRGQTTSPCPTATEPVGLGVPGRDLVQRWVTGAQANFGLTVRALETDVYGWKKFTGAGTANPPRLAVTHTPFDAEYKFVNPVPNPPVTRTQSGKVKITITNRGVNPLIKSGYSLVYRYFDASGAYKGWADAAKLPHDVARGASVTVDATIKATPPGTYRYEFSMMRYGGPVFTDEQIPPAVLVLRVPDVAPVIKAQYPPNGHSAPTLNPTLWAQGVDIDAPPNATLKYRFEICEPGPVACFDSGRQTSPMWTVPTGRLQWSKNYQWRVFAFDGVSESPALPFSTLLTAVPQPEITAHLGNAPYGGKSGEFDPHVGNYTASAVDATVSTIGPKLSVVRTYNSLDPRRDSAFGAGWSSQYDMRITPDDDGSGNVVLTYPDGQQARFGANLNASGQPTGGRLMSPPGRYATMVARTAAEGGGWTLTDKSASLYVFRADGRPTTLYDNAGRSIAFTYGTDGKLATVTNRTSNRALQITWSGNHIRTISTDPVNGERLTWTYTYDGDRLTQVCDPTDGCTRYDYTTGSHYRSTVVDSKPDSYWRLGEAEGADAFSQIGINLGTDNAKYVDVSLGADGVVAGAEDTAASFNGTTSAFTLPEGIVKKSRELTVEMWFRTDKAGPLFSTQNKPLGTSPTSYVPVLYVDTSGKLRGQFWTGALNQIVTPGTVTNNEWHHVVLSSSLNTTTMYLDGQVVGTKAGVIDNAPFTYSTVGAAHLPAGSGWPETGTAQRQSFSGQIDEVAVYQHPLGLPAVQNHYRARAAADQMTKTVLPSGKTAATMTYDTERDRLVEYTDRNGGTWELAAPVVSGDPTNIVRTVRVKDPAGRAHFYDYDPLRGRILRYLAPLGMETRPEDGPPPDESVVTPPAECPPPPDKPPFCEIPIGGGEGSFPPVEFQGARTFTYDDNGFQHVITDENGNSITLTHDARGNVASRKTCRSGPSDCQTAYFQYTPVGSDLTDPRLDKVIAARDARSTGVTDNRYRTAYTYTARGQLETQTTPDGAVVRHTYTTDSSPAYGGGNTPAGLVETTTNPMGAVTRYSYFRNGDLAQVTSATGLVTRFGYDALGRRISTTQISDTFPNGVTATVTYDRLSRPTVQTSPGVTNEITEDTHRLRTTTSYDADGNPTKAEAVDLTGGDPTRTSTLVYDDHNRVIRVTDAEGSETSFGYDRFGNRTRMVDASGVQYEYAYTARNAIAEVRLRGWNGDPDIAEPVPDDYLVLASYAYDLAGQLVRSTDAMGRATGYRYYNDGLLFKSTALGIHNPDGTKRDLVLSETTYDAAGNPARVTTAGGRVTTFETDAVGRRAATTADPGGLNRRTALTYNRNGDVTNVRMTGLESNTGITGDTGAEVVDFGYDPAGRQTSETVHTGTESLTTSYGHDQRGLVTSIVDPRGTVAGVDPAAFTTNVRYDELGQMVASTAPPVIVENLDEDPATTRPTTVAGYDTFGNLTHTTDANDNTWRYAYDKLGRQTSATTPNYTPPGATEPIEATTTTSYDELGRVTASTGPRGTVARYTYDKLGRLTQQTDPHADNAGEAGGQWNYTYTRTGELLSVTDPTGARTESTYDDLGRQITHSQLERYPTPGTYTSTFTYDDASNLTATATPSGVPSTHTYDALDQLTKLTTAAGVNVHLGYDRAGRQAKVTDGEGRASRTNHDLAGRATQQVDLNRLGQALRQSSFGYDRAGNLTTATNPLGHVSRFTTDALGRLTQQVEPVSATEQITTTFGYDAAGNRTRYTDGNGNNTLYAVNSWGLAESVIESPTDAHPDRADRTWSAGYDIAANPVTLTAPGGVKNTRTFDLLGQLTSETGTGAEVATTEKQYDHDQLGRLVTSTAPGGADTFAYNDRGAMLTSTGPSGDTTFGYDADGNLTTRTDAAGTATYGYVDNRLTSIRDGLTGTTQLLDYDDAGKLDNIGYGAGRNRDFSYDDFGRLSYDELNQTHSGTRAAPNLVASVRYGYDNDDRLTSKQTAKVADAGTNTYAYDQSDRLTSWTHDPEGTPAPTTTTYGWDGASNRVSVDGVTASFDERNRLVNDGTSSYAFTPRGTLTTKTTGATTESYAFDAFDRLASQGPVTYSYDALDRVASRNAQQFTYSGASNELATDGTTKFSRGPGDELLSLQSGADTRLTMSDKHGDVIAGFNPVGKLEQVADSTAYDPFGSPTATTGADRPIGYQGDYTDPDTGQVNMTARWYTPGTGTFTSRDNIPLPTNPSSASNRYTYTGGSPTNYSDPSGHDWTSLCSFIGGPFASWLCNVPWIWGNPPGSGGGSSGGCGGLSPDAKTVSPCCPPPNSKALRSCGNGSGSGFGMGGFSGSGGGAFYGPGRGGGRGGVGSAPRPDPSIAARAANRAAARNNPMPIPNAILTPFCGNSATAPVSTNPHMPSHVTGAYQDPIDDVNKSYQNLQLSITSGNPVLGTVKNASAAPSEISPFDGYCDACNWPTPDGYYPGMIGADGRPMIDLETLAEEGIQLSQSQGEMFQYGSDEDRAGMLDPIPGWQPGSTPTFESSGHLMFDLIGLVPAIGEWADGVNCAWYGSEGDAANAALSCAAVVPFLGWGAFSARWGLLPGVPVTRADSISDVVDDFGHLVPGRSSSTRLVDTEQQLRHLFDGWVGGAERLPARGAKIPDVYRLADGTTIQWRLTSKTGGPTIDVVSPSGVRWKVHLSE